MERENITFNIPYIKLRFYAEMLEDTVLPITKTSALRGGMGEMLLRQNCVRDRNCDACMFMKACPVNHTLYTYMEKKPDYVTGKESVGYLIECSDRSEFFEKGSRLVFHLILFGESIVYFNLYLQAFCQLGMIGIGKNKSRFQITEVRNTEGEKIVTGNKVDMRNYKICMLNNYIAKRKEELGFSEGRYTLVFTTPLSMRYQKKYMDQFYPEALLQGAARRIQMLNYFIGKEAKLPEFAQYPAIRSQSIKKESMKRYSSTHDARTELWGISGRIELRDVPEECIDYLIAGEITHIGKNTSFGFGKYYLSSM